MSHLEAFAFSSRKPLYNNSYQNIQGLLAKKNKIQIKVLDRPWPRLIPGVTTLKLIVTLVRNTAPFIQEAHTGQSSATHTVPCSPGFAVGVTEAFSNTIWGRLCCAPCRCVRRGVAQEICYLPCLGEGWPWFHCLCSEECKDSEERVPLPTPKRLRHLQTGQCRCCGLDRSIGSTALALPRTQCYPAFLPGQ
ncbi:prostaglandin F2 receptor negative regulator [Platysternon megacephalum]|uniref:Prostaglandin F2 receptor negative regulator n=1 Tax=Platysternon megacephalum TaxID=55544 RepID=A0A4D9ENA4_9SAUR|nr:prostaglandin F2 receptor negative regulator [Platysternon megacephalum]